MAPNRILLAIISELPSPVESSPRRVVEEILDDAAICEREAQPSRQAMQQAQLLSLSLP